jgi:gas vesicle protein
MSETKVAIALLAGLAAGAALGILLAPEAGTETRDKLNESLTNLGESIKDSASEQIDSLVDAFKEKVLSPVKDILGTANEERSDDQEYA